MQLLLIEPERRSIGGCEFLIVRGLVVNVSANPLSVPALQAVLQSDDGRPLHSWVFSVLDQELPPGQTVSFQTSTDKMVTETASVRVAFAPRDINPE